MPFYGNTLVPSAAQTTTGNTGALDIGRDGQFLNLLVNVTNVTGTTPTLDLTVQWSADGTNFATVEPTAQSFTQITAPKVTVKQFPTLARYCRIVWTIGGTTPSFTFSINGMAY